MPRFRPPIRARDHSLSRCSGWLRRGALLAATLAACTSCAPAGEVGAGGGGSGAEPDTGDEPSADDGGGSSDPATFTDTVVMFHLNLQEHGHLEESITYTTQVLDLHEELKVPLDVYLTTWMIDDYQASAPELLQRLLTSEVVSVNYHTRPPLPYRANFCVGENPCADWYGLHAMTEEEQKAEVLAFEQAQLDLETGAKLDELGGFMKLTDLLGRPPFVAGDESNGETLQRAVDHAFQEMGVTFVISHFPSGGNEGDRRNGVLLKPEQVDVKMFNTDLSLDGDDCVDPDNDGAALYECEVAKCDGPPPCTVAFKMHDNDFMSDDAWWGIVYAKKGPDWDTSQQTTLYEDPAMVSFQWTRYQQTVEHAASRRDEYAIVGAKHWAERLDP